MTIIITTIFITTIIIIIINIITIIIITIIIFITMTIIITIFITTIFITTIFITTIIITTIFITTIFITTIFITTIINIINIIMTIIIIIFITIIITTIFITTIIIIINIITIIIITIIMTITMTIIITIFITTIFITTIFITTIIITTIFITTIFITTIFITTIIIINIITIIMTIIIIIIFITIIIIITIFITTIFITTIIIITIFITTIIIITIFITTIIIITIIIITIIIITIIIITIITIIIITIITIIIITIIIITVIIITIIIITIIIITVIIITIIIITIMSCLLDHESVVTTEVGLHTDLWRESSDLPAVCFKKFCTHTLSLLAGHRPNMKVSEALKRQTQWTSGKIPDNFKTLYKQLLVPFESGEVVEVLRRILDKQEVNWQTLLSFLATFLVCFPAAARDIQDHVRGLLGDSLEGGDMEGTIVAFLLARQTCREGPHVFPHYSAWFQEMFSDAPHSPAASKKAFTFLVKFLTELVPFEPADILKVHILRPPFVPAKCRDVWTDYTALAKTRLADLKVPLEETNTAIYTDPGNKSGLGEAGMQDVEKALAVFESSGKLPTTVMEASIFRKPYFVGKFLPAVLQPRHLPDMADSRMKFIEALKKAGKIPSAHFTKYEEACKRETRQLLEGVFVEEEEEGVEEMMMSPWEQLTYRLKQLTDAVLSQSAENRVPEVVSVISEKLEAVLQPPSNDDDGDNHGDDDGDDVVPVSEGCMLTLCRPSLRHAHVKAVDAVLNSVCRTVHAAGGVSHHAWLGQVVRMISQHLTFLPAFFTRLLTLCRAKPSSLSQHHMEGLASFLVQLSINTPLLPPLILRPHPQGAPCGDGASFLPLFLHTLPVGSGLEMAQSLRFLAEYLQAVFVEQGVAAGGAGMDLKEVLLPRALTVKTCLLAWRLFPWTRPNQQSLSPPRPPPPETAHHSGESEDDRTEAILAALFTSGRCEEVWKVDRPTLKDWLQFELGVDPSGDVLSSLQRQTYHHCMMSHFTQSGDTSPSSSGTDCTHLQHTCRALMEGLARAMSRSRLETGLCSQCQQPLHVNPSVTPVNPHAVDQLLMLLARLMQNASEVEASDHDGWEGREPWFVNCLLQLLGSQTGGEDAIVPHALVRVVLSCPPHLLFTGWARQGATGKSAPSPVRFLQEFLVGVVAEGGVLSLDVLCHLLQGHMAAVKHCTDQTALQTLENHPLIVLSTLVHWHSVCVLLPSLPACVPWGRLDDCVHLWQRDWREGSLPSLTNTLPFCLAASLFSSHLYSNARVFSLPQVLDCLTAILIAFLSHSDVCSPRLPPQTEAGLQWLSELWVLSPHLITSAFDSASELSSLRSSLMPTDLEPFAEIVCLRCVGGLGTEKTAEEKGVLPTVTCLFARLCQRLEEGTPKQSAEVSLILDFSHTVVTLLRTAPLASLRAVQQILKNHIVIQDLENHIMIPYLENHMVI
ncbi:hypothetical protein ACOMHN_018055 [Nucella lapillus]